MICDCETSTQNTGLPNCVDSITYANRAFFVPLVAENGTANKIASGANVTNAYILARLNDTDPSKRWYPLNDIKNVKTGTPSEATYQTWDDKTKQKVASSVRSAEFTHANKNPKFLGVLESFECEAMGVFYVTKSGKIRGYKSDNTGDMYPISIQSGSMSSLEADATPESLYNITTKFDWAFDMEGSLVREWDNTVNWSSPLLVGLLDVTMEVVGMPNADYFDAKFYHTYGDMNVKSPIKGLVTADFDLNEVTPTPGTISFTAATTATDGTYRFTFGSAQTDGDVLSLTLDKQGLDGSTIPDVTITVVD